MSLPTPGKDSAHQSQITPPVPVVDTTESYLKMSLPQLIDKLQQAEKYVNYQEYLLFQKHEEITQLQHQLEDLKVKAEKEIAEPGFSDHNQSEVMNSLKTKLKQAAEYINYQTEQIAGAQEEIEHCKAQISQLSLQLKTKDEQIKHLQEENQRLTNLGEVSQATRRLSLNSSSHDNSQLEHELKVSQEKLAQAADYVKYQEDLLATQGEELSQTKQLVLRKQQEIQRLESELKLKEQELLSRPVPHHPSQDHLEEIETMKVKLEQAATFVAYQSDQLAERDELIGQLQQSLQQHQESVQQLSQQKQVLEQKVSALEVKLQTAPKGPSPALLQRLETVQRKMVQIEDWSKSIAEESAEIKELLANPKQIL